MLEVQGIDVAYGDLQALWQVSLHVPAGSVVALLGPNGAGKTTTLKTIMSELKPRRGSVKLEGHDINDWATHQMVDAGVALVPEGRGLFASMTVEDNLAVGAHLPRTHAHEADSLASVYDIFPILKERRRQLAGSLSGGQQQMLAIARALMSRPRLLILDEPSLGVAPVVLRRIFEVLADLNANGTTILLVEQSVGLALSLCQQAYILESGRVVAAGSADELREQEHIRHAYFGLS